MNCPVEAVKTQLEKKDWQTKDEIAFYCRLSVLATWQILLTLKPEVKIDEQKVERYKASKIA